MSTDLWGRFHLRPDGRWTTRVALGEIRICCRDHLHGDTYHQLVLCDLFMDEQTVPVKLFTSLHFIIDLQIKNSKLLIPMDLSADEYVVIGVYISGGSLIDTFVPHREMFSKTKFWFSLCVHRKDKKVDGEDEPDGEDKDVEDDDDDRLDSEDDECDCDDGDDECDCDDGDGECDCDDDDGCDCDDDDGCDCDDDDGCDCDDDDDGCHSEDGDDECLCSDDDSN